MTVWRQEDPDRPLCLCGTVLVGERDRDPKAETDVIYQECCGDCQRGRLIASARLRFLDDANVNRLKSMNRPRASQFKTSEAFQEEKGEWLGVRRTRPRARERNRCQGWECGNRVVDKLLGRCASCRDAHHRRKLRLDLMDLPVVRYPDILAINLRTWPVAQEEEFQPLHEAVNKEKLCLKP